MAETENIQENLGPPLLLERRVEVYPEAPLPEYDSPAGPAFAARFKGENRANLMAVVCTKSLLPRTEFVSAMRTIDNPGVLRLREGGVLAWPSLNGSYYVLAYERPLASRYWGALDETRTPMNEDLASQKFIKPIIGALSELQRTGIVHGGLRPTNVFWHEGAAAPPQLAECLSLQPGSGQPILFETIERGMCDPQGRGPGQHLDDCYACGVMFALVLLGQNPLRGMSDQAILDLKMEQGTYNALIGTQRLVAAHVELLRGLLADDPQQRWTAADLEQWQSGRRMTPKSSDVSRRASRHLSLGEKEYWHLRPLAAAMAANVPEAAKLIESETLEKWLTRSYGDEESTGNVAEAMAINRESGKPAHYEDQLVTRVCMALDPLAPIRYRGLSVMPGGITALLIDALANGQSTQVLAEIIASQFVTFWVNFQKEGKTDYVPMAQQLERARTTMEKNAFGSGLERAVYELNPFLPCLSPMLRKDYVLSPKRILVSLDSLARQPDRPEEPMDRHLAAYLIVRDKRSELLFASMAPGEPAGRRGLAMLSLFGEMQYRYGPDQLPGLSQWLFPLVEPIINRFLSKPFQAKIRRQAKAAMEKGDLNKLLSLVDDPQSLEKDEREFLMARQMYRDVQAEMAKLETDLARRDAISITEGRPVAALIASFLAIVILAVTIGRVLLESLR